MTLITAIAVGLACGTFLGFGQRALAVFIPVWFMVLVVQTTIVLDDEKVPPDDWVYVPVQAVIFLVGVVTIWIGARARAWLAHRSA